ncbi:MAG: hypothetical protein ABI142_06305 [Bryocella sp.]
MKKISHHSFEDTSLSIDDKIFKDCTIVNCVLEYSGGEVSFERTHLSGCRYVFLGPANSTLRMLELAQIMPARIELWSESATVLQ